ncbi:MAG: large-conductance mechanosensitive channel protein MscL [Phycisphaeraceae bacterium]|nr:large-conductance mechanosensitive channel protein MscL [Phycisphaeraceae bacterium]
MSLIQEFKEFAVKGNAVDMAVGLIVGAAFNKIVTSLVNDVIMPPLGVMIGGVDFKNLSVVLKQAVKEDLTQGIAAAPEVTLRYGMFINTCIDFLIVSFTIFMVIKLMNRVVKVRKPAA